MTEEEKKRFEAWYELIGPNESLTQGDLILDCPLVGWKPEALQLEGAGETEVLKAASYSFKDDVVVMTQACDLEQGKVSNVVLCPCTPLSVYRGAWESSMRESKQNPTDKAWASFCRRITDGFIWNITILDSCGTGSLTTEHRIVDFHEVFTVPREFLESLLKQRGQPRLRLLPPYREHLSQAFARFFMRVGLPVSITPAW